MAFSTQLPRPLLTAFERAFSGQTPDVFVRAPGRVNLLGGHVDMHEGAVINIAINREIWLAAAYGSAGIVHLHTADLETATTISLQHLNKHIDIIGEDLPLWARYPAGVAWALQRRGLKVNGINAVFLGNIPMRAGLSSSAAVEMAFAIAWQALENWRLDPVELALVGNEVEREYIGIGTGIQDQFTCLHAQSERALWLDCRTLKHRYCTLSPAIKIVICDTKTRRKLVDTNYSKRAQSGHDVAHIISLVDPNVKTLRDVALDRLEEFQALLNVEQFRQTRHVVTEIARVAQGIVALEQNDFATLGALMNTSYHSARNDYGSSSPALDAMWEAANQHPACYGARYSGGGEAGAAVALVSADAVEDFITTTAARYEHAAGQPGDLFVVEPASSAGVFM